MFFMDFSKKSDVIKCLDTPPIKDFSFTEEEGFEPP